MYYLFEYLASSSGNRQIFLTSSSTASYPVLLNKYLFNPITFAVLFRFPLVSAVVFRMCCTLYCSIAVKVSPVRTSVFSTVSIDTKKFVGSNFESLSATTNILAL